jgi:HlyD family secretion protein
VPSYRRTLGTHIENSNQTFRFTEGALVRPGEVLVILDTASREAQLAEAKLNFAATQEKEAVARATIVRSKAQIERAKIEVDRRRRLVAQKAGSQRELDVRRMALKTTTAGLSVAATAGRARPK